jgi:RNA polymerase sigma-70 factor (ECF subfamily)
MVVSEWYALTLNHLGGSLPTRTWVFLDAMSERELVARAKDGDVAAFEALYRQHEKRIYGLCLRMVADPSRAEDLTQEAFVRAWQKLGSFHGQSAFGTWLHRLTVNVVLGAIRSRSRRKDFAVANEELHIVPDPRPAPALESGIDLTRAISELPPKARVVFLLHDVEGLKHGEVAEALGIAIGTSKAHLHRARQILREALKS